MKIMISNIVKILFLSKSGRNTQQITSKLNKSLKKSYRNCQGDLSSKMSQDTVDPGLHA